jgi:putative heme-binding domain-containing protein
MQWQATYRPVSVDLSRQTDVELAELQGHRNEWHARTARRLLQERAAAGSVPAETVNALKMRVTRATDPAQRLRALWCLHAVGGLDPAGLQAALRDPDEFVRGWAIELANDRQRAAPEVLATWVRMAVEDPSPVVRRYLASAVSRVPAETAWTLVEALAAHGEDREDRNIPWLLWHGLAQRMPGNLPRALQIARQTALPPLADSIWWYAAVLEGNGLEAVVAEVGRTSGEEQRRRLAGLALALESRAQGPTLEAWKAVGAALYAVSDARTRRQAERVGALLGDASVFPRLRRTLADRTAPAEERQHALAALARGPDRESRAVFLALLEEPDFRLLVIPLLGSFDSPEVSEAVLQRFESWPSAERAAAMATLSRRTSHALALLEAVRAGRIPRDQLSSFQVRALTGLQNEDIHRQVSALWGRIQPSPAEKQKQIERLEKVFNEAPLWAYSAREGRRHFQTLCASCHRLGEEGVRLGPELTGAGKHGIRYILENVLDPNAVVGADFQLTTVETRSGEVVSGLLVGETAGVLTVRTTADTVRLPVADVQRRETSEKSLMPEGLLESLNDREQIELLKFLVEN